MTEIKPRNVDGDLNRPVCDSQCPGVWVNAITGSEPSCDYRATVTRLGDPCIPILPSPADSGIRSRARRDAREVGAGETRDCGLA